MRLRDLLTEHLQDVRKRIIQRDDSMLLKTYVEEWKQYQTGAQRNSKLMNYLNRHWCLRELDEGEENVHEIYPLHVLLWEEIVLDISQDVVRDAIAGLVMKRRRGEAVDEGLVDGLLKASSKCVLSIGAEYVLILVEWEKGKMISFQGSYYSGSTGVEGEEDRGKTVPDIYQLLLRSPAGETDEQILFRAVRLSYKPTLSYLFAHPLSLSPDTRDDMGRTPLSYAAQKVDKPLISFLLSNGASINAQDDNGVTPLSWAVRSTCHERNIEGVVKLLLSNGADVNTKDAKGNTAKDWAKMNEFCNSKRVLNALEGLEGAEHA